LSRSVKPFAPDVASREVVDPLLRVQRPVLRIPARLVNDEDTALENLSNPAPATSAPSGPTTRLSPHVDFDFPQQHKRETSWQPVPAD
jgi:hypothetical protein